MNIALSLSLCVPRNVLQLTERILALTGTHAGQSLVLSGTHSGQLLKLKVPQ